MKFHGFWNLFYLGGSQVCISTLARSFSSRSRVVHWGVSVWLFCCSLKPDELSMEVFLPLETFPPCAALQAWEGPPHTDS